MKRATLCAAALCVLAACGDDDGPRPAPHPEPVEPAAPEPPAPPPGDPVPEREVSLALGGAHSCLLSSDGHVRCWGANDYGQLGSAAVPTGPGAHSAEPVTVEGIDDAVRVAAGAFHTCAIRHDGGVACWGHGGFGQLGDGATDDRATPVAVALSEPAVSLALGEGHTCARLASRRVACWGRNDFGQLGDGGTEPHTTPAPVEGLDEVTAIGAGRDYACALRADGRPLCWGAGYEGQLGAGDRPDRRTRPRPVVGLAHVRAIVTGSAHACAVAADDTIRCWGRNDSRQVGDGSGGSPEDVVLEPAEVPIAGVESLAAGARFTCARLAAGTVRCWGYNGFAQLGDGTDEERTGPVDVLGLEGATAIAAGVRHACALDAGGAVWCWGRNHEGQLGDGTTEPRHEKVRVRL